MDLLWKSHGDFMESPMTFQGRSIHNCGRSIENHENLMELSIENTAHGPQHILIYIAKKLTTQFMLQHTLVVF